MANISLIIEFVAIAATAGSAIGSVFSLIRKLMNKEERTNVVVKKSDGSQIELSLSDLSVEELQKLLQETENVKPK